MGVTFFIERADYIVILYHLCVILVILFSMEDYVDATAGGVCVLLTHSGYGIWMRMIRTDSISARRHFR